MMGFNTEKSVLTTRIRHFLHLAIFGLLSSLVLSEPQDDVNSPYSLYLWPKNIAAECPTGTDVPQHRCLDALRALEPGDRNIENDANYGGNIRTGTGSENMPCGCFLWEKEQSNEYVLFYHTKDSICTPNNSVASPTEHSYLVCTVEPPSPSYEENSLHFWPKELKNRCPVGHEVSQEDCLKAGRALVPKDMPLSNDRDHNGDLVIKNDIYRPCGCHIWNNYKFNIYVITFRQDTTECGNTIHTDRYSRVICDSPPPCFLLCDASS